ncbi:hypothetical protein BUALT_Bualt04G0042500 [Buddleja alternifolia]|uniref:Homeobox domain-containing protein n=1 Tax=Buddleja alternifolia TaxID=168488 RepID=A0AAV6XN81_9LAMI|nr:hypothetical protein BUALT_Bualt04G0042500 [Buddleja alternifolia]
MEWEKQPPQQAEEMNGGGGGGGMFVKVMTDEQMEVLRKQIAVYATICEQLVELHKSLTSQNDLAGVRLGNLYCDPLITCGGHKMSGRQRWTPTPMQLQILERIFDQGIGTPSKQKIKEITTELSQHGNISETNVYNWFQNRRARSKRKQQANNTSNNGDQSEVDTEVESPKPSDTKSQPHILTSTNDQDLCFHPNEQGTSKYGDTFGQMPFFPTTLPNPSTYFFPKNVLGMEQLIGKMEVPAGNYNPYNLQQDDYNMTG